ncbi:hypothetical protein HOD29_00580 [archaeon]|jgi:nitroreductase|nr:hypothetical protein [archaeon]
MQLSNAIKERRSVRSYKPKKPDWRQIIEAIDTARYAPMAGDIFSLKFMLIDDADKIKEIAKWSSQEFIQDAKYVVAFITDPKLTLNAYPELGKKFLRQQAGAAIQNFLLTITEIGLGTCWIAHFNEERIKQLLKIPKENQIEGIFPIAYGKTKPRTKRLKGDLDHTLYFNEWKNRYMKKPESIDV